MKRQAGATILSALFYTAPTAVGLAAPDDYERAVSLYSQGENKAAYETFKAYLKENPGHKPTEQWLQILTPIVTSEAAAGSASKLPLEAPPAMRKTPVVQDARTPPTAAVPVPSAEVFQRPSPKSDEGAADPTTDELRSELLAAKKEIEDLKRGLRAEKEKARSESESQLAQLQEVSSILSETETQLVESTKAREALEKRLEESGRKAPK